MAQLETTTLSVIDGCAAAIDDSAVDTVLWVSPGLKVVVRGADRRDDAAAE